MYTWCYNQTKEMGANVWLCSYEGNVHRSGDSILAHWDVYSWAWMQRWIYILDDCQDNPLISFCVYVGAMALSLQQILGDRRIRQLDFNMPNHVVLKGDNPPKMYGSSLFFSSYWECIHAQLSPACMCMWRREGIAECLADSYIMCKAGPRFYSHLHRSFYL